jgi:hypothetical protein
VRTLPPAAPCAALSYGGGEYTFTPPKTSRARRPIDLPAFVVAFLRPTPRSRR